jgi:hypothetical protein
MKHSSTASEGQLGAHHGGWGLNAGRSESRMLWVSPGESPRMWARLMPASPVLVKGKEELRRKPDQAITPRLPQRLC